MRFLGPEADDEVFQSRHLLFDQDLQQVQGGKRTPYPAVAIHTQNRGRYFYLVNEAATRSQQLVIAKPLTAGKEDDFQKRCRELEAEIEKLKRENQTRTNDFLRNAEELEAIKNTLQAKAEEIEANKKEREEIQRKNVLEISRLREEADKTVRGAKENKKKEEEKDAEISRLKAELEKAVSRNWYFQLKSLPTVLRESFSKIDSKWDNFYISDWTGPPDLSYNTKIKDGQPAYFNDLETIDLSWKPQSITVNSWVNMIDGLKTTYSNGQVIQLGESTGSINNTYQLESPIVGVRAKSRLPTWVKLVELYFKTADGKEHGITPSRANESELVNELDVTALSGYSLRGFYGQYGNEFSRFGLIWGKD